MINFGYYARFKDRRSFAFSGYTSQLSGSRWFRVSVGYGRKGRVFLPSANLYVPVGEMEFADHPLIRGEEYQFNAETLAFLGESYAALGFSRPPTGDPFVVNDYISGGAVYANDAFNTSFNIALIDTGDRPIELAPEAEVNAALDLKYLSGAHIHVTHVKGSPSTLRQSLHNLMQYGGYVDGYVEDAAKPSIVLIDGVRYKLRDVTFKAIEPEDLFKEDEPLVMRDIRDPRGHQVIELGADAALVYQAEFTQDHGDLMVPIENRESTWQGRSSSHLLRRLSPAERALVDAEDNKKTDITEEMVAAVLGETLWSMITHYPTETTTRGLIFSRTSIPINPAYDTKEKIIAELKRHPDRFLSNQGKKDIYLPPEMRAEGERWWRAQLDLPPPPPPPTNPLMALPDTDSVIVRVNGEMIETQLVRQTRPREVHSSISVPAKVVKRGREAIIQFVSQRADVLVHGPEPEWSSSPDGSEFETNRDMLTVSIDGLDQFLTDKDETDSAPF